MSGLATQPTVGASLYTSRIIKASALIADTRVLLQEWDFQQSVEANLAAVYGAPLAGLRVNGTVQCRDREPATHSPREASIASH